MYYKGTECKTIPVRKSDGAMFCVSTDITCGTTCPRGDVAATPDGSHIFLRTHENTLSRLDLRTIGSSQEVELSSGASGGNVSAMALNHAGGLLTAVYQGSNDSSNDMRFYKPEGGFVNVARGVARWPCLLTGPGADDGLYYVTGGAVHHVVAAAGGATETTVAVLPVVETTCGIEGQVAATTTSTYARGRNGTDLVNFIVEILNAAQTPRTITFPELSGIAELAGCQDHLILRGIDTAGNDVVERYYPAVPTAETLTASRDYSITALSVDSACRITFSGRRASDNARIVGQIEPGSDSVKIIAAGLDADVTQVLAIH